MWAETRYSTRRGSIPLIDTGGVPLAGRVNLRKIINFKKPTSMKDKRGRLYKMHFIFGCPALPYSRSSPHEVHLALRRPVDQEESGKGGWVFTSVSFLPILSPWSGCEVQQQKVCLALHQTIQTATKLFLPSPMAVERCGLFLLSSEPTNNSNESKHELVVGVGEVVSRGNGG